jgi:DNA polymerase III subunit delta'
MSGPLPNIVGHAAAKQALEASLATGSLAGSVILAGPRGVGRRLMARELTRALNCTSPRGPAEPCGSCGPCHRIAAGTFADLIEVVPQDRPSIGIEPIKNALDELALAPVEGARRVFVFDPAGAITEPAQNALLKGLEEPPGRALIVLIAEREDELLPTVVSRCRTLRLGELSLDEVEEVLVRGGLPRDEARQRARWAAGSPGRALDDDGAALAEMAQQVMEAFTSGVAYADPMATVEQLRGFVDRGTPETAVKRERIMELGRALGRALRDAMVQREGARTSRLSGINDALLGLLAALPHGRLEAAVEQLGRVEEEVLANVNPTLVMQGLVLDLGTALSTSHAGGARRMAPPVASGRR